MSSSTKPKIPVNLIYAAGFVGAVVLGLGVALLLVSITNRKNEAAMSAFQRVEIPANTVDPAIWGQNYPVQYSSFVRTQEDYGRTPYGGSTPYDKLEANPDLVRLWGGYAFSKDFNEERGHHYALIDQLETQRTQIVEQPGACLNCHAAETPLLIEQYGWEEFNRRPYNEYRENEEMHFGASCITCHDPDTMQLVITRPAFVNAMASQGIDVSQATHNEMRTYVCAQCHVEYYFAGENKLLTFPWSNGLEIQNIQQYYDEIGFTDWTHAETGGRLLKMQHPEFELFSTGIHYQSGVSCADCHMPYVREGSQHVSDHWVRSPLANLNAACQNCHNLSEEELMARVINIQTTTADLLEDTERALSDTIDAIVAAREAGATEADLQTAYTLHRHAQMRWDFVASENSMGFHSPQEAARILAEAIDLARQAQIEAIAVQQALGISGQ